MNQRERSGQLEEPVVAGTESSVEEDFLRSAEYQIFVASFLKNLAARYQTLEAAFTARNYDELRHLAHSLASADIFGLEDLGRRARALEQAAKEHDRVKAEAVLKEIGELSRQAAE